MYDVIKRWHKRSFPFNIHLYIESTHIKSSRVHELNANFKGLWGDHFATYR